MVGPVPPPYGGIASVMSDIVSSDLSREYAFDVFARSAGFPEGMEGFWAKNLLRLRRFLRFFRQARQGKYGMTHIHSADPSFLGTAVLMLLARLARVRILLHMHGTDWQEFYTEAPPLRKLYTRLGLLLPDRILVLYSLWQEKLKSLGIATEVSVLPNSVHRSNPPDHEQVEETRQWLAVDEGSFVVVTVGTVGWRKGTFEILKAAPVLVRKDPSFRFVLVGGEEKPGEWLELMEVVKEHRLDAWVRFTGEVAREKIAAILAVGDVFLLPSFIEGMPIAIIEAMRSGLPIVTTRVNAIPDVIEDRVSGILIDPGDPVAIIDAVDLLRQDPALRENLSQGARKAFEERFEFSSAMERLRTVYDQMLQRDSNILFRM